MKIKSQILVYILSTTIVIFLFSFGYVSYYTRSKAMNDAKKMTDLYTKDYAKQIESELNSYVSIVRTMAHSISSFDDLPPDSEFDIYENILKNVFINNPNLMAVHCSWEYNYFDPGYTNAFGRIRLIVREFNGQLYSEKDTLDMIKEDKQSKYYQVKISSEQKVFNPFYFTYDSRIDEEMITTICVPLIKEGHFVGLASADVVLKRYQDLVDLFKPYNDGFAYFLDNDGRYISHPNKSLIGEKISEIDPAYDERNAITQKIKSGEYFTTIEKTVNEPVKNYTSFVPILIGNKKAPWSIAVQVPMDKILEEASENFRISVIISIIGLLVLSVIILLVTRKISNSLIEITQVLERLAKGDIRITWKLYVSSQDEIGQIKTSVNSLIEGLNKMADFAREIGKGNLNARYDYLSKQDDLGNSLVEMRKNLQEARNEEDRRKAEDAKQNWVTQGLAQLGDILRQNRKDIYEFANNIISNLCTYIGANQGGVFVINNDNPDHEYIQLIATYAYNRLRMIEKEIEMGRGLVGRCIQEKSTINLTEIPQDYIHITSGLGESTPANLIIVPLIFDEEIYGVVELASFHVFEKYQIDFVEKFGENIAASISNIKINIQTERLLEESKIKSEELAHHEQEMQQSLKELREVQEEALKDSRELEGTLYAITNTAPVIHFDLNGNILKINKCITANYEFYNQAMINRNHREFDISSIEAPKEYNRFWEDLNNGKVQNRVFETRHKEKDYWFFENYSPILDVNGKVYRIICIQTDITVYKAKEMKLKEEIALLDKALKELR